MTFEDSFQLATRALVLQMSVVTAEAAKTMTTLGILEEHLSRIQSLCVEESQSTGTAHTKILSELWTKLGGNQDKLLGLERRISVLQNVDGYRRLAIAHVAATMQTLMAVEEELSQLVQRLNTPGIAGNDIPIEVHVASIHLGVQRLKEEKLRVRVGAIGDSGMTTTKL